MSGIKLYRLVACLLAMCSFTGTMPEVYAQGSAYQDFQNQMREERDFKEDCSRVKMQSMYRGHKVERGLVYQLTRNGDTCAWERVGELNKTTREYNSYLGAYLRSEWVETKKFTNYNPNNGKPVYEWCLAIYRISENNPPKTSYECQPRVRWVKENGQYMEVDYNDHRK